MEQTLNFLYPSTWKGSITPVIKLEQLTPDIIRFNSL